MKQYLTLVLLGLLAMLGVACSSEPPTLTPTATSTPISAPTLSATPTSTATPTPVLASTPAESTGDMAFGYVSDLSAKLGPRESGTDQERAAADYLASQFEAMGYSVEAQTFTVEALAVDQTGLTLEEPGRKSIKALPLAMSGYGDASGVLLPVGLGTEEDIPEGGLAGEIALVMRGQITFSDKVNRAAAAGATGVIIYNNEPGNFQGALRIPSTIPAISISQEDGEMIEKMASSGQVVGTISIKTVTHICDYANTLLQRKEPGDHEQAMSLLDESFQRVGYAATDGAHAAQAEDNGGVLADGQAVGDLQALRASERRVVRVDLGANLEVSIRRMADELV